MAQFVTTAQAAERIGCSVRTVMRLIHADTLHPAMKIGGGTGPYLFDPAEVEQVRRDRQADTEQAS